MSSIVLSTTSKGDSERAGVCAAGGDPAHNPATARRRVNRQLWRHAAKGYLRIMVIFSQSDASSYRCIARARRVFGDLVSSVESPATSRAQEVLHTTSPSTFRRDRADTLHTHDRREPELRAKAVPGRPEQRPALLASPIRQRRRS